MNRGPGLGTKVLLVTGAILLVTLAALGGLLLSESRNGDAFVDMTSRSQTQLVNDAAGAHAISVVTAASEAMTNAFYYFDLESIGEQLHSIAELPPAIQAIAFNARGEVILDNRHDLTGYGTALASPLVAAALAVHEPQVLMEDTHLAAAHRISIADDEILGGVLVHFDMSAFEARLGDSSQELQRQLLSDSHSRVLVLSAFLAAIASLGVLLGWVIQRRIVRPILRLADAARRSEAGDYRYERSTTETRSDEIGQLDRVFASMAANIAETHARSLRRANFDKLTDLPNRHAFDDAIDTRTSAAAAAGEALALLYIDLDNLKRINDQFGHDAGDRALMRFASITSEALAAVADGDAWIARIGGDEFAAILGGRDIQVRAQELAADIIRRCNTDARSDSTGAPLGTSIGIALFPADADNVRDLLRCADNAMYRAKTAGKNRIQFYAEDAFIDPT